ncbi:MAG: hypothetical protein ACRDD1_19020, partial [Planctomycetia bacterium]
IGYSINDKIVIFDRIREVRGPSHRIDRPMVTRAVNQTLSRTIITSLTTLTVIILFIGGGPELRGFAFVLIIGTLVGTYSSIYIACPVLLAMEARDERSKATTESNAVADRPSTKPAAVR